MSCAFEVIAIPMVSQFRRLSQNTIGREAYKQQKFVSYSSGGWKSEIRALVRTLSRAADSHFPIVSLYGREKARELSRSLLQWH